MPLDILKNASLNAVFSKDTTIALRDFLRDNWPAGGAMGDSALTKFVDPTTTPNGRVIFDTKFNRMDFLYHVIIEPIPISPRMRYGGGRTLVTDRKRIQIFAGPTNNAKDKKWKLEQQVFSMINANPHALNADGVKRQTVSEFTEIRTYNDGDITRGVADSSQIARSAAIVSLWYDMIKSPA